MTEEELASRLAEDGKSRELERGNILERDILCALQTNSNLHFLIGLDFLVSRLKRKNSLLSEEVPIKNTTNLRDKYFITYKANQVRSD
jgi:hypothetical protein